MTTPVTTRVIEAHQIYSSQLTENRTVKVFLPSGYDPNLSYPVIYCHDGLEFFTHGRIATIAQQMMDQGQLQPLIIVGIAVKLSTRRDDYAPEGERVDAYMRFVVDEVLPFIEGRYAVRTDVDGRFMAGISLGAAVTLKLYLAYPQLFVQLILFSGAYYDVLQTEVAGLQELPGLSAYMVVGTEETAIETPQGCFDFFQLNQDMRARFEERGATVRYEQGVGKHIWGFWQSYMHSALSWMQSQTHESTKIGGTS